MADSDLVGDLAPTAPDASLEVIKRGETSLTMTLIRSSSGLTVAVKAHPSVEAFIRGLGDGQTVDVKAAGPYWRPVSREGRPLMVYTQTQTVEPVVLNSGDFANINRCGQPMIENQSNDGSGLTLSISGRGRQLVNLSFLRLVGISEGPGITFAVRGVHTYEAVNRMRELIGEAYKQFYRVYMKPIKMDIVVSTSETSL